jgi:hypothetical protein
MNKQQNAPELGVICVEPESAKMKELLPPRLYYKVRQPIFLVGNFLESELRRVLHL